MTAVELFLRMVLISQYLELLILLRKDLRVPLFPFLRLNDVV